MLAITLAFSVVAILALPFPLRVRYAVIGKWNGCVIRAARLLCGIDWRVEGIGRLPEPPFVILSNHQSAWETMGFHLVFPHLSFVMKRSLLFIPFFGWGVAAMGPISIDRSKSRAALMRLDRQGRDRTRRGFSVVVFPEGTRMPPGSRGEYSQGGAWLAKRLGLPVVPVAVNSGLCWPKNAFLKSAGLVTISVGAPIPTDGLAPREVTERARSWIQAEQDRIERPEASGPRR